MASEPMASRVALAVILSSRADQTRALREQGQRAGCMVLDTDDAYAAAVEILRAPRAALVIDLPSVRLDPTGLVDLADRLGVPSFGVGRCDWPGFDASLLTPAGEDLAEAISSVLAPKAAEQPPGPDAPPQAATPPAQAVEQAPGAEPPPEVAQPASDATAPPAQGQVQAPSDQSAEPAPPPAEPSDSPAPAPAQSSESAEGPGPVGEVLTPEELRALLGPME